MGKIRCKSCNKYLGNIEGSIRKGTNHICKECSEAFELMYEDKGGLVGDYTNILKQLQDITGGKV